MTTAIHLQHLQRPAYVYLRQSTPGQVHTHRESTERQYALAERAVELGWDRSQVQILDQDLGKSGTTTEGREDFHRLMAAVGLGEVGAVLALEASRLSRSQADWHKLMDICALTDTLIVDQDGIYDPNAFNDRVLLGFKGTWSHTELHALRLRLQDAKLHKARKGELRCNPPTGYIYDAAGALVLDPDESVVAAVARLFQQFQELGSAFGVMRAWAAQGLPFPRRQWLPGASGALAWGRLSLGRVLAILHNPLYTGTYVYGRRRRQPVVEAGQVTRMRTLQKPQPEWTVVIPDAHPASISWEQYVANTEQLTRNRTNLPGVAGRPREGAALLQGLVLCGRCGRRMSVRYQGTGGRRPVYECQRRRLHDGHGGICWSVPARPIDAAVEAHVLAAVTPANPSWPWRCSRSLSRTRPSGTISGSSNWNVPTMRPGGRNANMRQSIPTTVWWHAPWNGVGMRNSNSSRNSNRPIPRPSAPSASTSPRKNASRFYGWRLTSRRCGAHRRPPRWNARNS